MRGLKPVAFKLLLLWINWIRLARPAPSRRDEERRRAEAAAAAAAVGPLPVARAAPAAAAPDLHRQPDVTAQAS
jgi:hypothetical protein